MKRLVFLLMVTLIAPSSSYAKGLTLEKVAVEQLEQILTGTRGKTDAEVCKQLSQLELTERLSTDSLARWNSDLPGETARQALLTLADRSAFLDPPQREIPAAAKPEIAEQSRIMALAVKFVARTLHKLPDFFATRETTRFRNTTEVPGRTGPIITADPRFHFVDRISATVRYRDGHEEVGAGAVKKADREDAQEDRSTNWGVFGPLLGTVMVDASHGRLVWGHWEQGTNGLLAVFRYTVPKEKSHYEAQYCCLVSGSGNPRPIRVTPAYHGEIAIDPASGTVLRLVVMADLDPNLPIQKVNVLVEYGPVELGGKTYICPVRSVSMTNGKTWNEQSLGFVAGSSVVGGGMPALSDGANSYSDTGPEVTVMNDVVFVQYHLFRGDARILADKAAENDGKPHSHPAATSVSGTAAP